MRADAVWTDVLTAARDLLAALTSDGATAACWDDLLAVAKDRTLAGREYGPIADLLFDQVRLRGVDPHAVFRELVSVIAFGGDRWTIGGGQIDVPLDARVARARNIVSEPAPVEAVVVWLGYQGRIFADLHVGRVAFMDAHWHVPNARPDGQPFEHKEELWELLKDGFSFKAAERFDEASNVDLLVRVDLGQTTAAGAVERAIEIVDAVLDFSIHISGGIRPRLAEHHILRSGRPASSSHLSASRETSFPDDHYGARLTGEAIDRVGPPVAEALSHNDLPKFLAAALEAQTSADRPFSHDMAMRTPSDADIRAVVPLGDRVVQHVAAYARLTPQEAFEQLGRLCPHARWLGDVRQAVQLCLLGGSGSPQRELHQDLTSEWFANRPDRPWILFAADRAQGLLSLCRVESERAWIGRMLDSVSDHGAYTDLVRGYTAERQVLEARRTRVRNALVHGNPAAFAVVESVRGYAEFLSSSALQLGLEAYVTGATPANALAERTAEYIAMQSGQDAGAFWRSAAGTVGLPDA